MEHNKSSNAVSAYILHDLPLKFTNVQGEITEIKTPYSKRRKKGLTLLYFPQFNILQQGVEAVKQRKDQAVETVPEALSEQEHLNEGCEGFIKQERFLKRHPLFVQLLCGKG